MFANSITLVVLNRVLSEFVIFDCLFFIFRNEATENENFLEFFCCCKNKIEESGKCLWSIRTMDGKTRLLHFWYLWQCSHSSTSPIRWLSLFYFAWKNDNQIFCLYSKKIIDQSNRIFFGILNFSWFWTSRKLFLDI